jgi:hypothetical protein
MPPLTPGRRGLPKTAINGYSFFMTLRSRNRFFLFCVALTFAVSVGLVIPAKNIIDNLRSAQQSAVSREMGMLAPKNIESDPVVPYVIMIAGSIFALVAQLLIYHFFEKTQSHEVLFFACFTFSFCFIGGRIFVPLVQLFQMPFAYSVFASRAEIFGRLFGTFSLFTASVYAVNPKMQKQGNALLAIIIIALLVALSVPVDPAAWTTVYRLRSGFDKMFNTVDMVLAIISVVTFFISAFLRNAKEFLYVALGSLAAWSGGTVFAFADSWVTSVPAFILLILGSFLVCRQLHKAYLWE